MKKCSKCLQEKPESEFYTNYPSCKVCKRAVRAKYVEKNLEKVKQDNKKQYQENQEKRKEWQREYYQRNKKQIQLRKKSNPEKTAKRMREWRKDPLNAMKVRARNRVRELLREDKEHHTTKYLGCDWGVLKKHLEERFTEGMSWDNMNKWHIDHIIPLASAKTEEELIPLLHYTNLQPLWAKDNLSKGCKLPEN